MSDYVYKNSKLREISFPLGGIGTGCIGLSGNGRLIDWEIFNRPNKGSSNGFSHFSIKVESEEKVLDARILNGDLHTPYSGTQEGFGFGPDNNTMAGLPHFKDVEFEGTFPIAKLRFRDDTFPGKVEMTAFNPLIPLNDEDSSIPGAFFEIEITSCLEKEATYSIALSLNNPLSSTDTINTYDKSASLHFIRFDTKSKPVDEVKSGNLCIATDADEVSYQEYWYRGYWFDNLSIYWREFTSQGKLKNRNYNTEKTNGHLPANFYDVGTLAAHVKLAPGEKKKVRFIISWNFPTISNYWNPEKCKEAEDCASISNTWKNYYVKLFPNSHASASYSLENWDRLLNDTVTFKNALFSSTLPPEVIDAVSANISILKSPTCLRLEDGEFYAFEGCGPMHGSCEGSCTHVWNYAYALPFLFPKLERSMRDLDFRYNQREDGAMSFRLMLPLGRERSGFRPCADGQFGGVIKAYRDWKISGDSNWLKGNWEAIKKSIEFAWSPTNEEKWDLDKDGVLEGRQHHTLDMELFGPNSWLTGFYLAALKAGSEIAEYFGETETASEYRKLFENGKRWVDNHLFNGEYYYQKIDLNDMNLLVGYAGSKCVGGGETFEAYWNDEAREVKYQIGEGCITDQVLAQWHANLCGLGEIFNSSKVKKALESIYKYNYKKTMRNVFKSCRLYSLNDEGGVVICEWPGDKYKPVVPAPYSEETWSGCEYQVAAHMIQEGLIEEGIEIVRAVRNRYNGENRNPWNEIECGSNYARSMASYSLLNVLSGFRFDMVNKMIGFNPVGTEKEEFHCFWSLDSGWGTFAKTLDKVEIKVLYGELNLKILGLPFISDKRISSVNISGKQVGFDNNNGLVKFDNSIKILQGEILSMAPSL